MMRQRINCSACRGFTLIELMVTLAVLAILVTAATPSLQKMIRDNRVTTQSNELIALINLTRNQAIREGIDENDVGMEALLRLTPITAGWNGNVSVTGEEPAEGCPSDVIRCSENRNVNLTTTSTELSFESRGYLQKTVWSPETICLKHAGTCQGNRQHVQIRILPSGQIDNRRLACKTVCPTAD
ncbi:MAG: prepilin-type N-terminal cleavage/methylation domain-containing protein [Wenzhouxiangellaceae bacterium]|nr:prepilin-type N-terminal cleavage/methylation domain-containing protein [Wenzhouxiangellaceae bacterium]